MKSRFSVGKSDIILMMLWDRKAIGMEGILSYATKKGLSGMTGGNVCDRNESRGLLCSTKKRISAASNHRLTVKGNEAD